MIQPFTFKNSKGITYFLHGKNVVLKTGHTQFIYYFARKMNAEYAVQMPPGFIVIESKSTGLPLLKKST